MVYIAAACMYMYVYTYVYRCLHKSEPLLEVCDVYWKLKDSVAKYELLLLRALNFQVYLDLPHKVSPCTNCHVP